MAYFTEQYEPLKATLKQWNDKKQGYACAESMLEKVDGFSKHCYAQTDAYIKKTDLIWELVNEAKGEKVAVADFTFEA